MRDTKLRHPHENENAYPYIFLLNKEYLLLPDHAHPNYNYFIGLYIAAKRKDVNLVEFLTDYASEREISYAIDHTDSIKVKQILKSALNNIK